MRLRAESGILFLAFAYVAISKLTARKIVKKTVNVFYFHDSSERNNERKSTLCSVILLSSPDIFLAYEKSKVILYNRKARTRENEREATLIALHN